MSGNEVEGGDEFYLPLSSGYRRLGQHISTPIDFIIRRKEEALDEERKEGPSRCWLACCWGLGGAVLL